MTEEAVATIEGFLAGYVTIAGLPTWREVRGEGPAVVLLHGAFSGAAGWAAQAPALVSAGFRVHVPERRGHAHTPDVDEPLSYEVMAADTIAYLEAEVGGQPGHFPIVYAKTMTMIDSEPEIDLAELTTVSAPALVLQGDRDEVTLEHGAAVAAAFPDGRLAVLPGTHGLPIELPELVNMLLISFLRGAVPARAWV